MAKLSMDKFDSKLEDFESYVERLEHYFTAAEITENKASHLINCIDPPTCRLLKSQVAPAKVTDKTYEQLVAVLTDHFVGKPLKIAERFKFYQSKQKQGESVTDFAAALRQLSVTCQFGNFLNEALCDFLVLGLSTKSTQKKLLTVKDLTFKVALDTALADEVAGREAQVVANAPGSTSSAGSPSNESVNYAKGKRGNKPSKKKHAQNKTPSGGSDQKLCYRCKRGSHDPSKCRFKEATCFKCSRKGHIAPACRGNQLQDNVTQSKPPRGEANFVSVSGSATNNSDCSQNAGSCPSTSQANNVNNEATNSCKFSMPQPVNTQQSTAEPMGLFNIGNSRPTVHPIWVDVQINEKPLRLQVDSGSAYTIIPEDIFHEKLQGIELSKTDLNLETYGKEKLPLLGEAQVTVAYEGQQKQLSIVVASVANKPPIFGKDWLSEIRLNWEQMFHTVIHTSDLDKVMAKYPRVLKPGLGTMTVDGHLYVKPGTKPRFKKARSVPYSLRPKLEAEYKRLQAEGILVPVSHSDWATPVVPVAKADNSIRVCGDFKVTLNDVLDIDKYPLPNPQDLFAALAGGKIFTKLDLSHAYQQMPLDEESQKYVTINTHMGLFRYTRLPYGIASAPSMFQAQMEQVLQGIPGVLVFLDDILITGENEAVHLQRLDAVLQRLDAYGLRLKNAKCSFMQPQVEYLGHLIDADGLHPRPCKVEAIASVAQPTNVTQLKSFLGMLQYYARFLPHLSSELQPLYELLQDDTPWNWTEACTVAFESAKDALISADVLTHYDVTKPLKVECDASPFGVGAVLTHVMDNGDERPVAFASRTLDPAEQNYSQLEKEALAIIFAVKKFHCYVYGRQFTLVTDHKPLVTIFGPKHGIPTLAAQRLQRWAVILQAHQYDIEYRNTFDHGNADALLRLPLPPDSNDFLHIDGQLFDVSVANDLPISAKEVASASSKDEVIARAIEYTAYGWPEKCTDPQLQPYFTRRFELSLEQNCLLWGRRVVIPNQLRNRILQELNECGHLGITRMKALARSHFWWPKLDGSIETMARQCAACKQVKNTPPTAPLHTWQWATRPLQRVHMDYAEKDGEHFLILVDAYSKWPECFPMGHNTTTSKTIDILRYWFAAYGLPETMVSDNGPQFVSHEFAMFMENNGVNHIRVPPYHPASNGAAERMVQEVKRYLTTAKKSNMTLHHKVANWLFIYRTTPHTFTQSTPAELFLKRKLRTRFSMLQPSLQKFAEDKQLKATTSADKVQKKLRDFAPGDVVMVRNFRWQSEMEAWCHYATSWSTQLYGQSAKPDETCAH